MKRLTIVVFIYLGLLDEVVIANIGSYEIDNNIEIVFNSNSPSE